MRNVPRFDFYRIKIHQKNLIKYLYLFITQLLEMTFERF